MLVVHVHDGEVKTLEEKAILVIPTETLIDNLLTSTLDCLVGLFNIGLHDVKSEVSL